MKNTPYNFNITSLFLNQKLPQKFTKIAKHHKTPPNFIPKLLFQNFQKLSQMDTTCPLKYA